MTGFIPQPHRRKARMSVQAQPRNPIPNAAHRMAAERAVRIAHEQGAVECAAFFAELPAHSQAIVFALMARSAASRPGLTAPAVESPWWTAAELREAHRLHAQGHRETWVRDGHRIYQAQAARARRALEAAARSETAVSGNGRRAELKVAES